MHFVCTVRVNCPWRRRRDFTMGNYLGKHSRSLRRRERRPFTRTPPRQSWGRGPSPPGVAANSGPSVDVSFTASYAASTGRVPGLGGAFIIASTPCSCVGVRDQHSGIVRLFESSGQCSLPYLLTYLPPCVLSFVRCRAAALACEWRGINRGTFPHAVGSETPRDSHPPTHNREPATTHCSVCCPTSCP